MNRKTCSCYNKSDSWNAFRDKPEKNDKFYSLTENVLNAVIRELSKENRSIKRLQYDTFYLYNVERFIEIEGKRTKVERKYIPFKLSKNFCRTFAREKNKRSFKLREKLIYLYDSVENIENYEQMTFDVIDKVSLQVVLNDKRKVVRTFQRTQKKTLENLIELELGELENINISQILDQCKTTWVEFIPLYCKFHSLNELETSLKFQEIIQAQEKQLSFSANRFEKTKLETTRTRIRIERENKSSKKEN
jgi:hypothetical protein